MDNLLKRFKGLAIILIVVLSLGFSCVNACAKDAPGYLYGRKSSSSSQKTSVKKSKKRLKVASKVTKTTSHTKKTVYAEKVVKSTSKYIKTTQLTKIVTTKKAYKKNSKVVNIKVTTRNVKVTNTKYYRVRKLFGVSETIKPAKVSADTLLKGVTPKMRELWKSLGFELVYIDEKSHFGKAVAGYTQFVPNYVYVRDSSRFNFYHELGHVLWGVSKGNGRTEKLVSLFNSEKNKIDFPNKAYARSSKEEFFSECYSLYEANGAALKRLSPKMYKFIEESFSNIQQNVVSVYRSASDLVKRK